MPSNKLRLLTVLFVVCPSSSLLAEAPHLESVRERLGSGEPTRIVCFGDSITGAYYHTGGRRAWCDLLGIALRRACPQARLEMVNAGISGHTTVQALARIDKDVIARKPHLVVVMFGMNDVARLPLDEYMQNLETIVDKCHAAGAAAVVCTPNAVHDNPQRPNEKVAELSKRVRRYAWDEPLPLADCFADFQLLRERDETAFRLLMSDEIHPNLHGHRRFAEQIASIILGSSFTLGSEMNPGYLVAPRIRLEHTFKQLEAGQPIHLIAMGPYDKLVPSALQKLYPEAQFRITVWPTDSPWIAELSQWAVGIRNLKPDLVTVAVPASVTAHDETGYIREYEWVLNRSLPFSGAAWDVIAIHPSITGPARAGSQLDFARRIITGKDLHPLERSNHDSRTTADIVDAWITGEHQRWRENQSK